MRVDAPARGHTGRRGPPGPSTTTVNGLLQSTKRRWMVTLIRVKCRGRAKAPVEADTDRDALWTGERAHNARHMLRRDPDERPDFVYWAEAAEESEVL